MKKYEEAYHEKAVWKTRTPRYFKERKIYRLDLELN